MAIPALLGVGPGRQHAGKSMPQPTGFLLLPGFTLLALASAIEPLRIANRYAPVPYDWRLLSLDGAAVPDRNGMPVQVAGALAEAGALGTLVVVADLAPGTAQLRRLLPQLRARARAGIVLGALDTAPLLLAQAGLLDGHRATAHWEVLPVFRERYPQVEVTDNLVEVDRQRFTCAGGTAVLDLMLADVEVRIGRQLALRVSEHCLAGRPPRPAGAPQRLLPSGTAKAARRRVQQAIALLEPELEQPRSLDEVARETGMSERQLRRVFARELGVGPRHFQRQLRLEHAHQLLVLGNVSVAEAAVAAGFRSRSAFSRAYRARFGHAPRVDRR
jgi:AraC family carnitine catabolism transcriptional activator